jgi:hypothetical protein
LFSYHQLATAALTEENSKKCHNFIDKTTSDEFQQNKLLPVMNATSAEASIFCSDDNISPTVKHTETKPKTLKDIFNIQILNDSGSVSSTDVCKII